jgi:hypothetical protein
VAAGRRSQFIRECEGHQEVRHRQQETLLVLQPELGLVILALGTVPVLAGVKAVVILLAVVTVIDLAAKPGRAARLDVLHGPTMRGRHPVAKLGSVRGAMKAEDVSQLHHQRSLMRRLMASEASCSARTVRWV